MGDYAAASLTFYACPAESVAGVLDALDEALITQLNWAERADPDVLVLWEPYTDGQAALDICYQEGLAGKLAELGATFVIEQEAKWEYDGTVAYHTPELGLFFTSGNQNGSATMTSGELDACIEEADGSFDALVAAIHRSTGSQHRAAIDVLDKALQGKPEEERQLRRPAPPAEGE